MAEQIPGKERYIDDIGKDKRGNVYHVQFYITKADFNGEFYFKMDVRPVAHGEWWPAKDGYYGHVMCSACHKIESHKTDFCPNCWADMRGGDEDG